MRGKAQRVARPAQTRLQNSRVTAGPKITKFFVRYRGVIGVLTSASVLRCSRRYRMSARRMKMGMPIFAKIGAKNRLP